MKRVIIILFVLINQVGFSQNNLKPISIGEKVPEAIWRTIPRKATTQIVILDFWYTTCSSCIEAFPEMIKLQNQFKDVLQVVLVNGIESDSEIKQNFSKHNAQLTNDESSSAYNLPNLPMINKAATLRKIFPSTGVPHHVWIDQYGVVKAITHYYNATPEHVKSMLEGKKINMFIKDDLLGAELVSKGVMRPFNTQLRNIYYSAFTPFLEAGISGGSLADSVKNIYRYLYYNDHFIKMYRNAFRSNDRERLLIELKNTESYTMPVNNNLIDDWCRKYCFTYEIQMPIKDKVKLQQFIQQDLNRFFGYTLGIEGKMEKRQLKNCWIMVKSADHDLRSKSNKMNYSHLNDIYSWSHYAFYDIVNMLRINVENLEMARAFIDESGIDPKLRVDMQVSGDLKNLSNVKQQLKPYGLDIIEGEREVDVLVIKDK